MILLDKIIEEIVFKNVGLRSQAGGTPHAIITFIIDLHSSSQHLAMLVYPNVDVLMPTILTTD